MKAADPRTSIWRYGAESFHRCESSRSVIGTRHRDANTPAVMHGRVRVAPSPVPRPDLDVLRAATLQLAEWSGLVGHLHELMSGLSGCL
jgi:hypothetical protein